MFLKSCVAICALVFVFVYLHPPGRITTNGVFDYETKEQYTVTVGVRDNPNRAWVQETLTVDITNINEDIQNFNLPTTVTFNAQQLVSGFQVTYIQ